MNFSFGLNIYINYPFGLLTTFHISCDTTVALNIAFQLSKALDSMFICRVQQKLSVIVGKNLKGWNFELNCIKQGQPRKQGEGFPTYSCKY